jgi:hypothetical protein
VPTCCIELADRSGAAAREGADRTAFCRMRLPHVRSMPSAVPARSDVALRIQATLSDARNSFGNLPIASDIISLTALSCRRTFADSATKKASLRRQRFVPH